MNSPRSQRDLPTATTEHQFRIDGTFNFSVRNFEITARNMYVRRFVPTPADDTNRYRGRIAVAHPLKVQGRTWTPFASYETFYEAIRGWNRDRIWTGVTLPLSKHVLLQPSYMWETTDGLEIRRLLVVWSDRQHEIAPAPRQLPERRSPCRKYCNEEPPCWR